MELFELSLPLDPMMGQKLAQFEILFEYPLGDTQQFRIDHSPDYTAFYFAMGEARTWILVSFEEIIATLSISVRHIALHGISYKIAYIGNLKIHPLYRSGRVLFKMINEVRKTLQGLASSAYSVVMDNTPVTPDRYTGRLKIPLFKAVAKLYVLRFEAISTQTPALSSTKHVTMEKGYSLYQNLSQSVCELALINLRSLMEPQWISSTDQACGMIEDTQKAKRLYLTRGGEELKSTHLSYFTFQDTKSAFSVLTEALRLTHQNQCPALFLALSEEQYVSISPFLNKLRYTQAMATIYATDTSCSLIPINTSEI